MKMIVDIPIDAYYHTKKRNLSPMEINIILEAIRKSIPFEEEDEEFE